MNEKIIVKGARQHNLDNIDVEIPRNQLVVITGLSGSGKSSLAFDTIYAEGQRRYVESLSAYARQFLGQMDKPDVDYIEGLSPAISIDQRTTSKNPRSTVGTVTEIYDYLRLLYARIGKPHCPNCGDPISQQSVQQIVDQVLELETGTRIQVLAPVVRSRKGEHKKTIEDIRKGGFVRIRVNGQLHEVTDNLNLDKNKQHTIEAIVDRLVIRDGIRSRLNDSVEIALQYGNGIVIIDVIGQEELLFSEKFACIDCGISMEDLTPRMFSFNSPYGACSECGGLGSKMEVDLQLVMDPEFSLNQGALIPWKDSKSKWLAAMLEAICKQYKIDPSVPLKSLSQDQIDVLLYGPKHLVVFEYVNQAGRKRTYEAEYEGLVPFLEKRHRESTSEWAKQDVERFMGNLFCGACNGKRLRPEILGVTINGKNIMELSALPIHQCLTFLSELPLSERDYLIGHQILKEINARLGFLQNVGLDYLAMDRAAATLSGGEAQRIRLATQIGSSLMGVIYILDEPSIGLHQRDNQRLLDTLKNLRDIGNTLIVVEHDEETMRTADWIIDMGPGAGAQGGKIVAAGEFEDICANEDSITGLYLSGKRQIPVVKQRRKPNGNWISIKGASENNLQDINVDIPLGVFVCVTGVSGSGKSTLVNEILCKALAKQLHRRTVKPGKHKEIQGVENLEKIIEIDQSPIGRTPRSNPATYTGAFDGIRDLFSITPEAKIRGYKPGRFSFNVRGGRCETCSGDGIIKIEMHFLPDVYVPCEVCKGSRYNSETLEVRYKGKNIADVLDMRVEEAVEFFQAIPKVQRRLQTLKDVGLGYIKLGQPATQLSGGEAQRVKLATELSKRSNGRTLYILDEPTTGLHFDDIRKLLDVLGRLVDSGDTVLVIEHNLDVIKTADYLVDLGPEGGDGGGKVIATGTPEQVAENPISYTGKYLKQILNSSELVEQQAIS